MAMLIERMGEGADETGNQENGKPRPSTKHRIQLRHVGSALNEERDQVQPLVGFFHEFDELQEAHIEDESESASGGTVLLQGLQASERVVPVGWLNEDSGKSVKHGVVEEEDLAIVPRKLNFSSSNKWTGARGIHSPLSS